MEIDKDKKVGNPDDTTPGKEGKKPDDTSTGKDGGKQSDTPPDESAKKIADLQTRLDKETKDKEIYRAGLLAAKELGGKPKITPEDMADPKKLDSAIDAKIQQENTEKQALAEAEAKAIEDERLKAENEELRRSLDAAKTAGFSAPGVGSGHNESSESQPQGYWSDAQRAHLRQIYASRNMYTSEKIEQMVKKAEEIAQSKSATSDRPNDMTPTRQY